MSFWDDMLRGSYLNNALPLSQAGISGQQYNDRVTGTVGEVLTGAGLLPQQIGGSTPGSELNTGYSDEQRRQLEELLAQLQQQAATGSGSWENALQAATQKAQATASALGQTATNAGGNYQSGLRDIGNAQSGAEQRAVGQGNILREQSKLDAQDQLGQLLGSMGSTDIEQANASARVKQQVGATNLALIEQAEKNMGGIQQGIASAFSDGGQVPGQPKVFGNDERNDIVPAMLSPKEVVLPITVASDPEAAAAFVAALNAGADPRTAEQQATGGVQHMADGGGIEQTGIRDYGEGNAALSVLLPHIGSAAGYGALRRKAAAGPPSIDNGGLLDTTQFDATRAARGTLQRQLAERAAGGGPSVVPQMTQNANDAALFQALEAQQRGAPAASMVGGGAEVAQGGAGDAAAQKANEQRGGQRAAAGVGTQARAQELSMAQAQQQAAWQNTMQNLGLSLANQQALRNMFAGAGQALTAAAGADRGLPQYTANPDNLSALSSQPFDAGLNASEWDTPDFDGGRGGPSDIGGSDPDLGKAFGGKIGYAEGGKVDPEHSGSPDERRAARAKRKQGEWDEEEAGTYSEKKPMKPVPTAKSMLADFARSLGATVSGAVPRFAEGGGVADSGAGGGAGFDPFGFPDRRDQGPVVYVSPTPVPGTQPVQLGGAGGGAGGGAPDAPSGAGGAGGGGAMPTGAGGASGAVQMDRGSGGATGGPAGNQVPQHEAIQPRAERPQPLQLPPGVVPKTAGAPPAPAPAAPPAPAPRAGGAGVALPPSHALEEGFQQNEAQLAAQATTEAEVARARAEAAGIAERQKAQADAQIAMKEAHTRARQQTQEAMTRWTAAQEEFNRIDTKVDAGRYWASRTTPQKILHMVGLALGAAGSGPDGINKAALMMNQAIDRDIDVQKIQVEAALKKGGQKLQAAQTYYGMAREAGHDDIAATELAKSAALESAALKAEQLVASVNEPIAKAKGQALAAALRGAAIDKQKAAEQQTFENRVKNQQLNIAATAAGAAAAGGKTALKDLREAKASYDKMAGTVAKLKGLIGDTNVVTEKVGSRAAQMETLAGDLLLQVKTAENLGALDKGSIQVAEQIIGDPTATFTLDSTKIAKLDALLEQARAKVQATAGAMQ